ncbi:MAG: hypothetical protein E7610_00245 [Ruminococcaceae bacterium]|nr:hypothetical protein [Oscillospiraceae bacterium]
MPEGIVRNERGEIEDALTYGNMAWLDTEDGVLGFARQYSRETVTVFINFSDESRSVAAESEILLACGYDRGRLEANGWVISKKMR